MRDDAGKRKLKVVKRKKGLSSDLFSNSIIQTESLGGADQCKRIRAVNRARRPRIEAVAWLIRIGIKRCELLAAA
jgi:hypothetical protein